MSGTLEALGDYPTLRDFSALATVPELEVLLWNLGIIGRHETKLEPELRHLALNCLNRVVFSRAHPDVVKCFIMHFKGLGEVPAGDPSPEQRALTENLWYRLEKRGDITDFLRTLYRVVCEEAAMVSA